MIPRLDISFQLRRQWQYWFGRQYQPRTNESLLNHARSGIVLALRAALPNGGRVGVMVYNCHTVANAIVSAGCTPVFLDVTEGLTCSVERVTCNDERVTCNEERADRVLMSNDTIDAIIVTNLFGIRNNISAIRAALPHAVIIVDNAHGYRLPPEGDFTVYSINQGKYPALGPGGILVVNNQEYLSRIKYPRTKYGTFAQIKIFLSMLIKAVLYSRCIYGWFTLPLKSKSNNNADHTPVQVCSMCPGVSRMYQAWVEDRLAINKERLAINEERVTCSVERVTTNDERLTFNEERLFMDIIYTHEPQSVIAEYRAKGIEADTHFKNCISWAREFGYVDGSCPTAERLVHELVMVPNYWREKTLNVER